MPALRFSTTASTLSSANRSRRACAALAAVAVGSGSPSRVLDERVAALQRALRVVGGERECETAQVRGAPRVAKASLRCARRCTIAATPGRDLPARGQPCAAPPRAARAASGAAQPLAGRAGRRARARGRRAGGRGRSPRRARGRAGRARRRCERRASLVAVQRHRLLGGMRRRRAARQRRHRRAACGRCGGRPRRSPAAVSIATVRHSVSSQKQSRSASEPPPRATIATSTSPSCRRDPAARGRSRGAAWRSWTGAKAHTRRPAQPRRRSAASTSSRALPLSPQTTPIVRGSAGRGSALLALEQTLRVKRLSEPRRAARAGRPRPRSAVSDDREGERGRGGGAARVVVAAALDDDLRAVGQRRRCAASAAPSPVATSRTGSRRRRRAARSTRAPATP